MSDLDIGYVNIVLLYFNIDKYDAFIAGNFAVEHMSAVINLMLKCYSWLWVSFKCYFVDSCYLELPPSVYFQVLDTDIYLQNCFTFHLKPETGYLGCGG